MEFIRKIIQTNLFKITSFNSVSVLVKIGIGLVTSKLLAVFVGPSGMALVGNLRNFSTSLESISTLGFQNGIVKYVAENKDDKQQLQKTIATVFISLFVVAIVLSSFLYFLAAFWNQQIFGSLYEFEIVFRAAALALPWFAISVFFLSVINGLGKLTDRGSALLIMGIVGGALIPPFYGWLYENSILGLDFRSAFLAIMLVCYTYILWFALAGHRVGNQNN